VLTRKRQVEFRRTPESSKKKVLAETRDRGKGSRMTRTAVHGLIGARDAALKEKEGTGARAIKRGGKSCMYNEKLVQRGSAQKGKKKKSEGTYRTKEHSFNKRAVNGRERERKGGDGQRRRLYNVQGHWKKKRGSRTFFTATGLKEQPLKLRKVT